MKPLPDHFIGRGAYRGFIFDQLLASNIAYVYQVDVTGQMYYQIFKKKINTQFGNVSYPSPETFGRSAWNYRSLDKAMQKFNQLNEEGGIRYE
jgi:hypothetical protein